MFNGPFDTRIRFAKVDRYGDLLKKLSKLIAWKMFWLELDRLAEVFSISRGGSPPICPLLKLKILVLESLYNLSDDVQEQQILDHLSFVQFLDLGTGDDIPDSKIILLSRETFKADGVEENLFARFGDFLNQTGCDVEQGWIVDAAIFKASIRRASRAINEKSKNDEPVKAWTFNQRAQKDVQICWTQKNGNNFFEYKNYAGGDLKYKVIQLHAVTPAPVYDSHEFESLLTENADPSLYVDSAYMSDAQIARLSAPDSLSLPCIHEKRCANSPLNDEQCYAKRKCSLHHVRSEYVFGA